MMKKRNFPLWTLVGWGIILVTFIGGILFQPYMHNNIPIHWNLFGEADHYTKPWVDVYVLPLVNMVLFGLMLVLPKMDPKKANYVVFNKTYRLVTLSIVTFFSLIIWMTDLQAIGIQFSVVFYLQLLLGILMAMLGNWFGRIRHNYFIGIRTPWTLSNETVWNKTHRFTGKLYVLAGAVTILAAFLPHLAGFAIMIAAILASNGIGFVYSYIIFQKL